MFLERNRKMLFPGFFIFKDLSSLKMLAHSCAGLVPAVSGRTLIYMPRPGSAVRRSESAVESPQLIVGLVHITTTSHIEQYVAQAVKLHNRIDSNDLFSMLIKKED